MNLEWRTTRNCLVFPRASDNVAQALPRVPLWVSVVDVLSNEAAGGPRSLSEGGLPAIPRLLAVT